MATVLVVDDEPIVRDVVVRYLEREGYATLEASDGDGARLLVERSAPDLVVLDVMLPKMNGFEVCRRMRADPRWREIRVLMLTAKGRDTEVSKGLGLGADAYVTKPFSTRELVAQVRGLLPAAVR